MNKKPFRSLSQQIALTCFILTRARTCETFEDVLQQLDVTLTAVNNDTVMRQLTAGTSIEPKVIGIPRAEHWLPYTRGVYYFRTNTKRNLIYAGDNGALHIFRISDADILKNDDDIPRNRMECILRKAGANGNYIF